MGLREFLYMISRPTLHRIDGDHIGEGLVSIVTAKLSRYDPLDACIRSRINELHVILGGCLKSQHQDQGFVAFKGGDKGVVGLVVGLLNCNRWVRGESIGR